MGNQKQKWTAEEEGALRAGVAKHGIGKWKNILVDVQFAHLLANRSNIDLKKWTAEEEEALRAGVDKHGTGKWKNILTDPQFAPSLQNRSNIDLKDKWRNLSVSGNVSTGRERVKMPKLQGLTIGPPSSSQNPVAALPLVEYNCTANPSESSVDKKIALKYDAMIFEALSSMNDPNGLDSKAIVSFIEQRYEVAQSFRRVLNAKLRRLVSQGKLEKVENCYKIRSAAPGTETLQFQDGKPNDDEGCSNMPKASQKRTTTETLEDATLYAAYRIAEAENKSCGYYEAVQNASYISALVEEAEVMLLLATDIYEKCARDGIVLLKAKDV